MLGTNGSLKLFRAWGIQVYLHWSWFVIAVIEIQMRLGDYRHPIWNVLEYLSLFAMVLLHEFGHALACRSVGGRAEQIVLWPLGGVAYVEPPQRPGPTLWSIAAGPLVNVSLLPLFPALLKAMQDAGLSATAPDACNLVFNMGQINKGLLFFNILPIFPLDGGQILRSMLWFVLGRGRSLMVASVVGFLGVAAMLFGAWRLHSTWLVVIAGFALLCCWNGFRQSLALMRTARLPRRGGYACPSCHKGPPIGDFWMCPDCRTTFDTFRTGAACPHCGARFGETRCMHCGAKHPLSDWYASSQN